MMAVTCSNQVASAEITTVPGYDTTPWFSELWRWGIHGNMLWYECHWWIWKCNISPFDDLGKTYYVFFHLFPPAFLSQCFKPANIFHWSWANSNPFSAPPIQKQRSFYRLTNSYFSTCPPVVEWRSRRRMRQQACYLVRKQEGLSEAKLFRRLGAKKDSRKGGFVGGFLYLGSKWIKQKWSNLNWRIGSQME